MALAGQRHAPVIELIGVSKWFGAHQVLRSCTTSVTPGEVVVIVGPSGSGKSTLVRTINALEPFQEGEVIVDGMPIGAPGTDLRELRTRVGMVFQQIELFPHLSALANVALAQVHVLGRDVADAHARGQALLSRVGLAGLGGRFPDQLSGGQQQRVAIARALAMDPKVMLFDEPTSALDPETVGEVLDVVLALAKDGMTMMIVTHEMGFARRVANRVLFMDEGEIVEDRDARAFFAEPGSERTRAFLAKVLSR